MGDSSDDDSPTRGRSKPNSKYILYKRRPEWKDVVPIPQDDGPHPVVAINYSEQFSDVFDYFRAIFHAQEKSERALQLTEDALDLNTANYTVWQFRRVILKHLNSDLNKELEYVKSMIHDHPKNYQVWHHRRVIVEWKQDPSLELALTQSVLDLDAKNYHAWQHRQWVILTFQLFDGELQFTEELLSKDDRNNSAWNQRYFVLNNTSGFSSDVVVQEIEFTCKWINLVSFNESAWNYLRGILTKSEAGLGGHPEVISMIEELYNHGDRSPYMLGFLVELLSLRAPDDSNAAIRMKELCKSLAEEYDTVRTHYWTYLSNVLQPATMI